MIEQRKLLQCKWLNKQYFISEINNFPFREKKNSSAAVVLIKDCCSQNNDQLCSDFS